jgi:carboxyl-terminal processing protease
MPRRNLFCLMLMTVVSLACYGQAQHNRFGRSLGNVFDRISRRYFEPVDDAKLFQGAMEGMVSELPDGNSMYISPKDQQKFETLINRRFEGVGMEILLDPKTKQLTVETPLVGSPAFEAGVRAGDRILKIDDRSTQGMSLTDAIDVLRGQPGTTVTLVVLHEGDKEPARLKIVRGTIVEDSVRGDTRNADGSWNFSLPGHDRIGYVRILGFADDTTEELRQSLDWLAAHRMRGLVLDLRDNHGGLLESAIGVCDLFIASGVIVSTHSRQDVKVTRASGRGPFTGFPMAVLVNHDSASASEIVAACLQDHHRAVIVGERSYGKGTVQEVCDLGDHRGELKLTVESYWRPSGKNIHRGHDAGPKETWGVQPDKGYKVVVEGEEAGQLWRWRQDRDIVRPAGQPHAAPAAAAAKPAPKPFVDRALDKAVAHVESAADMKPAKRP